MAKTTKRYWECSMGLEIQPDIPADYENATREFDHKWPRIVENSWKRLLVETTGNDEVDHDLMLRSLLGKRFAVDLQARCHDPQIRNAFEVLNPFGGAQPTKWRIGTNFHGGSAPVEYRNAAGAQPTPWRFNYQGATPAGVFVNVQIHEICHC